MAILFESSPTIKAEELSRINQECFDLEQLIDHRTEVHKIYNLLLSIDNGSKPMSRDERANIKRWINKLFLRIMRSNDLIKISQIQANSIDDSGESTISSMQKRLSI